MARVSKADMTEKNPAEWVKGAAAARAARENVAEQLAELLHSADQTGSPEYVAKRIRSYAKALRHEDPAAVRSALMELSVAAAATAAGMDARQGSLAAAA